jgi:hypothetical protein
MIFNPWVILGAIVAGISVYFYGHHVGWTERDEEMQLAIAKKNEEAREVERAMTSKLVAQTNKLQETNDALSQKTTALDRAIRAGRVRLPATSCVQPTADPAPADSNRDTETSESDRQTLAAIAAIVAEGDAAINQLNACISTYNEMRELVNAKR